MRRSVQIPSIGDQLILDKDWTFTLWNEYRNETLWALQDGKSKDKHMRVTLPKGTELRVDRIYIRKGIKDYDSITFLAKGLRKDKVKLPTELPMPDFRVDQNLSWEQRDALYQAHCQTPEYKAWRKSHDAREHAKRLSRPTRFWAKLHDVNRMVVRSIDWFEREETENKKTRQIEVEE